MKRMPACLHDSVDTQASHFLTLDRNQGWYYMCLCAVAVYIQNQYLVDCSRSSNKIPYIRKAKQFINISHTHTHTHRHRRPILENVIGEHQLFSVIMKTQIMNSHLISQWWCSSQNLNLMIKQKFSTSIVRNFKLAMKVLTPVFIDFCDFSHRNEKYVFNLSQVNSV